MQLSQFIHVFFHSCYTIIKLKLDASYTPHFFLIHLSFHAKPLSLISEITTTTYSQCQPKSAATTRRNGRIVSAVYSPVYSSSASSFFSYFWSHGLSYNPKSPVSSSKMPQFITSKSPPLRTSSLLTSKSPSHLEIPTTI